MSWNIAREPGETDEELRGRLDEMFNVDHVVRCAKCGKVQFISDGELKSGVTCGPDFALQKLCNGELRPCGDHDALLAAYKLGGEEAAVLLLFNGCKSCVHAYLYGSQLACPEHAGSIR